MSAFSPISNESFVGLSSVLRSVTTHRINQLKSAQRLITELTESWCKIRRDEIAKNARENHHFNPLRSITIKETDHSRILGGLLDPRGSHGQKSLFLNSFLQMLGIDPPDGKWIVTVESGRTVASGRVDILLCRDEPASVVIIENKVHRAQDQDGQLYRYWFHEINSQHPDLRYDDVETAKRFKVVYLPPGSYAFPAEHSLLRPAEAAYANCEHKSLPMAILDCRSFRTDVAGWLKDMAKQDLSTRLKTFLNLYAEIWSI